MKKVMKFMFLISMFILLVANYAAFVERNLLVVRERSIQIEASGTLALRVVQVSDIHLGEYYTLDQLKKVVDRINRLDPDIVVFTGDLMDNAYKYDYRDDISEVLVQIQCKIGKYAIYGNHDYGGGAVRYYDDMMAQSGFEVLKNQKTTVMSGDVEVTFFGSDDGIMGKPDAPATMEGIRNEGVNILLLHEPDLADDYKAYPLDLILSGHSHGGQVYIPFYGALKKNRLSENYSKGLYPLDNPAGTTLYVSSGIGNTKSPFRLFNAPEIAVFDIHN